MLTILPIGASLRAGQSPQHIKSLAQLQELAQQKMGQFFVEALLELNEQVDEEVTSLTPVFTTGQMGLYHDGRIAKSWLDRQLKIYSAVPNRKVG